MRKTEMKNRSASTLAATLATILAAGAMTMTRAAQTPEMTLSTGEAIVIEGESLVATSMASSGDYFRQEMSSFGPGWSGGAQLFWTPKEPGALLRASFDVPRSGRYEAVLVFTTAPDYAVVETRLDGGDAHEYNGFGPRVSRSQVSLGIAELAPGPHELTLAVSAADARSTGYFVGMDRLELRPLGSQAVETPPVVPASNVSAPEPWTTQDIIDPRIDVTAQYALMRMCRGGPDEVDDMSGMLSAVKSGELEGIYIQDQRVPALRARDELGKGWWDLLPEGIDARCLTEPATKPPLIVMRKGIAGTPARLDPALQDAWRGCGLTPQTPRGCRQTLPPKQPREPRECGQRAGNPSLRVFVLATDGSLVSGAQVVVSGGESNEIQASETGGLGVVGFTLLGPGVYSLKVSAVGFRPSIGNVVRVEGSCSYTRSIALFR